MWNRPHSTWPRCQIGSRSQEAPRHHRARSSPFEASAFPNRSKPDRPSKPALPPCSALRANTGDETMSGDKFKRQEPDSRTLSGSVTPIWLQSAADLRRPRNALTIAIGHNPFREARRVATIVFTYHACSSIIIPATVVSTVPSAMRARTVISANDDGVRVGSRWDGRDG